MKKILIAVGILCGAFFLVRTVIKDRQTPPQVDPILAPIVDNWKRDLDSLGIDYIFGYNRIDFIKVSNIDKDGYSNKMNRTITIDKDLMETGSKYKIKAAVYHELGHYVYCLTHKNHGIMHSPSYREDLYKSAWNEMLEEYLKLCKKGEYNVWI
jgi:hypothetical protein